MAVANLASAIRFINELKDTGCRFSWTISAPACRPSSHLKHLPVDYLKIDGSFVRTCSRIPSIAPQVINHIGHVMGKRTIAEFVETVK